MTERDEQGRFISGNSGGPGRPPKKREERFLEITLESCTFADWRAIVKKAVDQARRGNATARKWLSDYVIGPPTQKSEVTGKDGGPIQHEEMSETRRRLLADIQSQLAEDDASPES